MMAKVMMMTLTTLITLLLSILTTPTCGRTTLVGGKEDISDVKSNMQVQELGRFAVEEYNKGLIMMLPWNNDEIDEKLMIKFGEVVEAQHQVVSGIKYYLKISASQNGVNQNFTSVVVLKPWLHSKKVLHFGPSSRSSSTTSQ